MTLRLAGVLRVWFVLRPWWFAMSGDPLIGRVEPGAKLTPSGAGNGVTEQKAGIPGMGLEWPPEPFSSCISLKKKKIHLRSVSYGPARWALYRNRRPGAS